MKRESGVPPCMTKDHIGIKVLFRLANNRIAFEGVIDELSPGGDYIHIGKHWVENGIGAVLAILSEPHRRREAIK